jgi:hypothetical protein
MQEQTPGRLVQAPIVTSPRLSYSQARANLHPEELQYSNWVGEGVYVSHIKQAPEEARRFWIIRKWDSLSAPLRRTVAAAGLGLAVVAIGTVVPNPFSQQVKVEAHTSATDLLERDYPMIRVLTARQAFQERGVTYPNDQRDPSTGILYKDAPTAVSIEQATILRTFIENAPSHLLEKNDKGERLEIVVSTGPHQGRITTGTSSPHQVEVAFNHLTSEDKADGFEEFIHELIHANTPYLGEPAIVDQGWNKPIYERRSQWFNKVYQIFGLSFDKINRQMKDEVVRITIDEIQDMKDKYGIEPSLKTGSEEIRRKIKDPKDKETFRFYERLSQIQMYTEDASELTSFLGERYIYGEANFKFYIGRMFGEDKAKELYALIRDDVFRGIQYPEFPIQENS